MREIEALLQVTVDPSGAVSGARVVKRSMQDMKKDAASASSAIDGVKRMLKSLAVGFGIKSVISSFIKAAAEAETYRQRLRQVIGDYKEADKAFERVKRWASLNPVDTDDAIAAFVRLKSAAVKNTEEALKPVADLASVVGFTMTDVAGAIVSTEVETLRRMGIILRREKDEAIIQSGEVKKVVKNDLDSIRQGILDVANANFGGSMLKMGDTWRGIFNTLGGMWTDLMQTMMGSAGSGGPFDTIRLAMIDIRDAFTSWMDSAAYGEFIKEFQTQVVSGLKTAIDGITTAVKFLAQHFDTLILAVKTLVSYKLATWLTGLALSIGGAVAGITSLAGALNIIGVIVAGATFFDLQRDMEETAKKAQLLSDAVEDISTQFQNADSLTLREELGRVTADLEDMKKEARAATDEILRLSTAKFLSGNGIIGGNVGAAVAELKKFVAETDNVFGAREKLIARRDALQNQIAAKDAGEIIVEATQSKITPDETAAAKASKGGKAKSATEKMLDSMRDQVKYLNADAESFLPVLDKWQGKLKPLSDDWKLVADYQKEVTEEAASKMSQRLTDALQYGDLTKDGLQSLLKDLEKYRDMTEKFDKGGMMSDVWKSRQENVEAVKNKLKEIENMEWSKTSWEYAQGFLKATEYLDFLREKMKGLSQDSEEYRKFYSEIQNIEVGQVSKTLDSLKTQFDMGKIGGAEYESALVDIMDKYKNDFPLAVQAAIDALQQFREEQELTVATTQMQLSNALKEATKNFQELEGKGILGVVDGFLNAAIHGEDFGDSLKRLGEDILFTTLRMFLLQQITNMFGFGGGGGIASSFMGSVLGAMGIAGPGGFTFARGGAFDNGRQLKKYALGGIVNEPAFFPMRTGMGLVGEGKKKEGIFPLDRLPNGELGVQALMPRGDSESEPLSLSITIENNTGTQMNVQTTDVNYEAALRRISVRAVVDDIAGGGQIGKLLAASRKR